MIYKKRKYIYYVFESSMTKKKWGKIPEKSFNSIN